MKTYWQSVCGEADLLYSWKNGLLQSRKVYQSGKCWYYIQTHVLVKQKSLSVRQTLGAIYYILLLYSLPQKYMCSIYLNIWQYWHSRLASPLSSQRIDTKEIPNINPSFNKKNSCDFVNLCKVQFPNQIESIC